MDRELPNAPVHVEPQVFDLLDYLVRNRDRVVSKDDLIASVWGGRIVSDSTLTSRINAARKGGLQREQILNTRPLAEVQQYFARRKEAVRGKSP